MQYWENPNTQTISYEEALGNVGEEESPFDRKTLPAEPSSGT